MFKRNIYLQTEGNKDNATDMNMVEHVTFLDWGCLALLYDSYMSGKSTRAYIHPKLSPYKTTFRIEKQENETDSNLEDLNRFVLYLNNMLSTNGIHTILASTEQVEMYLIPFVVSVDRTSLKNGIIHVEDPSTTLKEPIQVGDLVEYITTCCSEDTERRRRGRKRSEREKEDRKEERRWMKGKRNKWRLGSRRIGKDGNVRGKRRRVGD